MLYKTKNFLCIIFVLCLAISCSTPRPSGQTEAEILYKEALGLVEDSRFLLATEKLNSIRSKFPYSYYATHGELLQADILFKQENYVEAAAAYILFRDFHPKNKKLGYVIWKIAESFYLQLPDTFDRDLTPGHEAIKYYAELLRRFPGSEYTKDSREKIKLCNDLIQEKEKYIADFYFKTEVYDSARFRYLDIIERFHDSNLKNHSMLRVLESSLQLKDYKGCVGYYSTYKMKINKQSMPGLKKIYQTCNRLLSGAKS